MASFHHRIKSGKKGTAAEHSAYIARQGGFSKREDLVCSGYGNMPSWSMDDPRNYWIAGDRYERSNGAVYREHEIALPEELTVNQQKELVDELIEVIVGQKPYQFAIHSNKSSIEEVTNTHVHLMYSDRMPDDIERAPEKTFSRFNAMQPERGGCKKDSGGKNKLEMRLELIEKRRKCAELQNAALEKHGHAARVDHRTLKQQGIERSPEVRLLPSKIKKMTQTQKQDYVKNRRSSSAHQVNQAPTP